MKISDTQTPLYKVQCGQLHLSERLKQTLQGLGHDGLNKLIADGIIDVDEVDVFVQTVEERRWQNPATHAAIGNTLLDDARALTRAPRIVQGPAPPAPPKPQPSPKSRKAPTTANLSNTAPNSAFTTRRKPPTADELSQLLSSTQFITWLNLFVDYAESRSPTVQQELLSLSKHKDWDSRLLLFLFKTDDWDQIIESPLAIKDVLLQLGQEAYTLVTNFDQSGVYLLIEDSIHRSYNAMDMMGIPKGGQDILIYPFAFGTTLYQFGAGLVELGRQVYQGKHPDGRAMSLRERIACSLNLYSAVYGPKFAGKAAGKLAKNVGQHLSPEMATAFYVQADGTIAQGAAPAWLQSLTRTMSHPGLYKGAWQTGVLAGTGPVQLLHQDPVAPAIMGQPIHYIQGTRKGGKKKRNRRGSGSGGYSSIKISQGTPFSNNPRVNKGKPNVDAVINEKTNGKIPKDKQPHNAKHAASEHVGAAEKAAKSSDGQFSHFDGDNSQGIAIEAGRKAVTAQLQGLKPTCPNGVKNIKTRQTSSDTIEVCIQHDKPVGTVYQRSPRPPHSGRGGEQWSFHDSYNGQNVFSRNSDQSTVVFRSIRIDGRDVWYPLTSYPSGKAAF